MRTISYKLDDLKKTVIKIGYVGENRHTQVRIDCKDLFKEYPDAAVSAAIVSPAGQSYPKAVTVDGSTVVWDVADSDLAAEGDGEIQLTFTEGGVVAKTAVARFNVYRSITAEGPAPDPVDDWLQEASEALEDIEAAEVNQPIIGQDGYWYTWGQEAGEYQKTDTKAQGEDGQPGHTPEKGVDYWTAADKAEMESDVAGAIIDDTSTALNKTWSASKTNTLLSEITSYDNIHKAIISVLQHVAFIDDGGKDEYDALYDLVYPPVIPTSITAVYSGTIPIYESDDLSILTSDLVVTATYEDETSEVITSGYELSGSLVRGTSTITVSYRGKTDTFDVTVYGFSFVKHYTNGITSNVVRIKENNARLICDGTTGNIPFKFEDESSSGFYPVPIRTGATSITCDVDTTAARLTLGIFYYDTSVNDFKRTYGSDWSNVETFDLTSYNNGTYYVAFNLACTNLTSDTASLDTSTWSVSVN